MNRQNHQNLKPHQNRQSQKSPRHALAQKGAESTSWFNSLRLTLLYLAPPILYFSYHPRFLLSSSASTNYELSLPLIWLALFAFLSLKDFFLHIYNIYINNKPRLLFYLFPLYLSLSALWSLNPLRAVLTSGVFWCILISAVGILTNLKSQPSFKPKLLEKSFLISAVLVSLFCWLQCILDIWLQFPLETFEVPRELTLLCPGCTSRIFGFPHPSGFAIEPQFMGNLLLAPTFYSFYLFLKLAPSEKPKVKLKSAFLSTFLLTTLFLVFSRGAIYSFGIGLIFLLLVWTFKFRLPTKKLLQTLTLGVISLVICLSAQAIFANSDKSPRSIKCTLSTSLAQLTLDLVNFDCRSESTIRRYEFSQTSNSEISAPSAYEANHPQSHKADDSALSQVPSEPVFSGYVAESTNIRLGFNQKALEVALETPAQFIFGSGLGSAGKILYERGKTSSEMEIVQNEYFSLLLETGLIGLVLLLLSLALLIKLFRDKTAKPATSPRRISLISSPESAFIFSTVLAFAFPLNFFSGLPNALHLYLFPVILLTFLNFSTKNLAPVSPRKTKP